ncbi:MAG: hypothetical protein ACEPO2_20845 [Pelagibaca sp.]
MIRFGAILITAGLLAGCAGDPLRDVPRLSDTDMADAEIQPALREDAGELPVGGPEMEPQQRGLFGRLFGGGDATLEPDSPLPQTSPEEAVASVETVETAPPAAEAAPRRGLLGFLSRAAQSAQGEDGTRVAAIPPQTQSDASPLAQAAPRGGPSPGAPDYQVVAFGTVLPYGVLARVCDVNARQLGSRVARYPDNGSAYTLYDSQPGTTAPHTFYVTGFDDGCARQFTAALAMFGSPETHEQLRYGLPSQVQPYSSTDAAYETLKSRICRVGKGKPCGAALSRLSRNTAFVSVYETFGSNPEWKTILLHDGEVAETDIRSN